MEELKTGEHHDLLQVFKNHSCYHVEKNTQRRKSGDDDGFPSR